MCDDIRFIQRNKEKAQRNNGSTDSKAFMLVADDEALDEIDAESAIALFEEMGFEKQHIED